MTAIRLSCLANSDDGMDALFAVVVGWAIASHLRPTICRVAPVTAGESEAVSAALARDDGSAIGCPEVDG